MPMLSVLIKRESCNVQMLCVQVCKCLLCKDKVTLLAVGCECVACTLFCALASHKF